MLRFALAIFYDSSVQRIPKKKIDEWLKGALARTEIDSVKLTRARAAKVLTAPLPPVPRFVRMCRQISFAIKDALEEYKRDR